MTTGELAGQVGLITGGARGLGLAIAERLVDHGARVAIVGRSRGTIDAAVASLTSRGGDVLGMAADVSLADDADRMFDELSRWSPNLHIVVNNAGIADEAALDDVTREGWDHVLAVNLTAPFFIIQRATRVMSAGGSIVNIGSIDAYGADGPFSSYVAAKAGLIGMTKAAAVELASRGIRVNVVSPGWTLTDMAIEATSATMLAHMQNDFARVPMRRMLNPEEIAAAVTFLASSAASGITGVDLVVDGGTLANLYIMETLPQDECS